jgi:hypothetical protein
VDELAAGERHRVVHASADDQEPREGGEVRSGRGGIHRGDADRLQGRDGERRESSGSGTRSRPVYTLSGCGLLPQSRTCARLRMLTGECFVDSC